MHRWRGKGNRMTYWWNVNGSSALWVVETPHLRPRKQLEKSMPYLLVGNTSTPLSRMVKFVRMLNPDVKSKEGLKTMFDTLYIDKKLSVVCE
jgi:hypothetical protein